MGYSNDMHKMHKHYILSKFIEKSIKIDKIDKITKNRDFSKFYVILLNSSNLVIYKVTIFFSRGYFNCCQFV